jgi:hypothetical protein
LVLNQHLEGLATAYASFNVDKSGNMGNVLYNANVTGAAKTNTLSTLYFSNQSYAWSSQNGWDYDGSIAVSSQSIWYTFLDWTASGSFHYGDNKYYITAVENNFNNHADSSDICSNEFYLVAYGGYGASSPYVW